MKKFSLILAALLLAACSINTQSGGTFPTATPASMEDVSELIIPAPSGEGPQFENGVVVIPQDDGSEKSVPVFEDPAAHIGETVLVYTNDNSKTVPTLGVETIPSGATVTIIDVTATTVVVAYDSVTYSLPSTVAVFIAIQ